MFPHMPMHGPGSTAGCRGSWATGWSASRRCARTPRPTRTPCPASEFPVDREPQPYREVKPGEPGYEEAKAAAETAAGAYHDGRSLRGHLCPDTTDIVDPDHQGQPGRSSGAGVRTPCSAARTSRPAAARHPGASAAALGGHRSDRAGRRLESPARQLGRLPGQGQLPGDPPCGTQEQQETVRRQRAAVQDALATVKITPELRALATTPQPFGLWESKPACADALSKVPHRRFNSRGSATALAAAGEDVRPTRACTCSRPARRSTTPSVSTAMVRRRTPRV